MAGSDPAGGAPAPLLIATIATMALSGCYIYQPLDTRDPPAPGQDVRIRYESPQAETPTWQRQVVVRPPTIQGRVIEWRQDSVMLAVFPPPVQGMSRASPHPDTVRVPVEGMAVVELRELSRARTAAFGIGAGVVGAAIVRALFTWTRSGSDVVDPVNGS